MKKINLVFIILGIIFFVIPTVYGVCISSYHTIIRPEYNFNNINKLFEESHNDSKWFIFGLTCLFVLWITYCIINLFRCLLKEK